MKKTFLLIVACVFAFATVHAQSSEVEATTQLTKAEQFLQTTSFVKEQQLYKQNVSGVIISAKLFTNLKTDKRLSALEFTPSAGAKLNNSMLGQVSLPLGYLDLEEVNDFLLALETILEHFNNSTKEEVFSMTYSAPGGIDILFEKKDNSAICILRKKWYSIDDYGTQTTNYSEGQIILGPTAMPKLISSIKEAQMIANQALAK